MCGISFSQRVLLGLSVLPLMLFLSPSLLAADPGTPAQTSAILSDHKPGSVLFYNLYSSNSPAASSVEETEITLTNTGSNITARLFFVNGSNGTVKSEYFCLGANQSVSILASQFDPGASGYVVAVALDSATGCPVSHNFLIGDAYFKLTTGYLGRLKAVAAAANFSGVMNTCGFGSTTAAINFDDSITGYNRVPRTLLSGNIPSRGDGNATRLIVNRIGGNLATGVGAIGPVSGVIFDDEANNLSFSGQISVAQFQSELTNSFPPILPPLETFISAGRSGWLKLSSQNDAGILGAMLNFNVLVGASAGAFNNAANMRYSTLATNASYTIPVNIPNCTNRPVLTNLSPGSAPLGQAGIPLTVRGYNFQSGAMIQVNGNTKATSFVSGTQLTTTLAASDLASPGAVSVTVINPSGAPSNILRFSVVFEDELAVDDGSFENIFGFTQGGTIHAVNRLTPKAYPATVNAVSLIFFGGSNGVKVGDQFEILLGTNADGDNNINNTFFQKVSAQVQKLGELVVYSVPGITLNSGDFVIGIKITHTASTYPIALDRSQPFNRRSYFSGDGTTFLLIDDPPTSATGNFGIRARLTVPCSYEISPTTQALPAASFAGSVNVIAGSGCSWTAVSDSTWLTITSGNSGSGNGTVNYSVAANTTNAQRSGTLTIAGKAFTVTQAAPVVVVTPTITGLNPNTVMAGSSGFTLTVNGINFVNGATVRAGGISRTTAFVSATQLTASMLAGDITTAGVVGITVVNPAPNGGISSNFNMTVAPLSSLSAASFLNSGFAPESIVAMFGLNLATGVASASGVPLPTVLIGTRVRVRDSNNVERDAPLFFVSPSQINYLIPAGTSEGTATVTASINNIAAGVSTITVAKIAPGLFSANTSGQGVAAAIALRVLANGQQRFESVAQFDAVQQQYVPIPIDLSPVGESVYPIFYGTGFRANNGLGNIKVIIGGVDVPVSYASLSPGFIGLDQMNVGPVPRSLIGRGTVNVVITVDGKIANTVQLSIK